MSETPEQLRARADALEAEAENIKIRLGYWCGYVYDRAGRCFEEWLVEAQCPHHTEPYTDEYDYGVRFCHNCRTREGKVKVPRRIYAPQYNGHAPKGYTP